MRGWVLSACLALGGAGLLGAQQRAWSAAWAAGYGAGTGSSFNGKGAVWGTAAGFLPLSQALRGGIELGFHRFNTIESRIPDAYGPGSLISEDFSRSFWQLSATMRLRAARGTWRPYVGSGLGAYRVQVHDRIRTQDGSGAPIPGLQFEQRGAEVKPGMHALVGIDRAGTLGSAALGLLVRGDFILAGGLASVVSFGVTLSLD
jgi:hypothetical protein